jgi:hypothetical protein
LPDEWDIGDISCTEDVLANSVRVGPTTFIDILVDPCENVVCTFENFPTGDPTSVVVSSLAASGPQGLPVPVALGLAGLGVVVTLAFATRRRRGDA